MFNGQRIKELRLERGLNQRQLATAINVSQPTIVAWENDKNEPKASYIMKLAEFFEVSADYLLNIETNLK